MARDESLSLSSPSVNGLYVVKRSPLSLILVLFVLYFLGKLTYLKVNPTSVTVFTLVLNIPQT